MFYGGKMKGMPPKLMSDDGKHIVIRPLAYCREKDIQRFADAKAFPIIPCNLCGSQPNLQRQVIADMLRDWDKRYPGVSRRCSAQCRMWCRRICAIPTCSISKALPTVLKWLTG